MNTPVKTRKRRSNKDWSKEVETISQMIEMREAGNSYSQIGRELGFNPNIVSYCINRGIRPDKPTRVSKHLDDVPKWIVAYENGLSCAVIGELFGVSDQTVYQHLKKNGVQMRPRGSSGRLNGHQTMEMIASYRNNLVSASKLADEYGVGYATVRRRIAKAGAYRGHTSPKLSPDDRDQIIKKGRQGAKGSALARQYGVTHSCVRRIFNKAGIRSKTARMSKGEHL